MRLAAVFGTRDRVIVNVIRNALGIPVKWYFSYEEILQDNMRFDWVIASTSAPCRTDVTEAIKRLQDISERLILFAKEPLFDSEKIHWILGKQFTVREIKEQLQALVSQAPQQHIEDNDCACETSINTGGPAREEGLQQGILCAIGQEDIESRLEAKINFIGKAKNVAELMDYTGTLRPETIILSIRLPGMDNPREIVTDILSKCRRLVFLAGDIDPEEKWMETLKSRGAHVIFDPVNITELLEAITGRDVESSDIKAKRNNGLFVRLKDRAEQIIERVKPAGTLDQNENTGQADYNKAVANASWYSSTCDFHRTSNELADESLDASRGSAPKKTVVLSSLEKLNKLKEGAGKIARKTRRESSRNTSVDSQSFVQKTILGTSWYSLDGGVSLGRKPVAQPPAWQDGTAVENWQTQNRTSISMQESLPMLIYATGLTGSYPFAVFQSFEALKNELEHKKPDAIVFGVHSPNLIRNIRELRRRKELLDVPIAVLGTEPTRELLLAGVDECFWQWDAKAYVCLEGQRNRLREMWEKINDEAAKDELTGVYNRKYLVQFCNELIKKYHHGMPFSLLVCDLDHFKSINDTYGHHAGDEVLKKFAVFLKNNVREVDIIFRYGGEEFLVFFANKRKQDALIIAERLRAKWEAEKFYNSTFSGGIAEYSEDIGSIEELIKIADKCLYEAKQAGRNQIKVDPTPTKDLPGKINCCNGQQTGLIQARPATDQSREGVNVSQPVPASERLAGVVKAKTVAVTSLISDEGGTPLILSLIQHLMGREPVAVIDGDVEYRGLGTALSVSDNPLVSHSWDRHAVPVVSGNIKLYPLHRSSLIPPSPDALTNVINLARQGTDLVLIDCGSLKDTWYYRSILEEADVIVWHYIDDRIAPEEARFRWKERLKILTSLKSRQREIMVFQGQVDAQLIEDIFRVPVVKLKSMDDQAGLNLLLERIRKAPFQGRTRVLVAGYDMEMVPRNTPDELYDFVYDPEEACEWLRNHHYDAAIVNFRLRGASLLEYDLRERGIVVQKQ